MMWAARRHSRAALAPLVGVEPIEPLTTGAVHHSMDRAVAAWRAGRAMHATSPCLAAWGERPYIAHIMSETRAERTVRLSFMFKGTEIIRAAYSRRKAV